MEEENNEFEDDDFKLETDEAGEEVLIEKEKITNNTSKTLSENLFEILTDLDLPYERFFLVHPDNLDWIIVFVDGSVFVFNQKQDYFVSLIEVQVIFKEMKIPERNFWDLNCMGYMTMEFTEEQIILNKQRWS